MLHKTYPIVLFVYNRPIHTKKTLEALEKNVLANMSSVFIYHDGIGLEATEDERAGHQEVGKIISGTWNFHSIKIIQREKNLGLAQNIKDGVTHILESNEALIVLEDDIVTHPDFLTFMNTSLIFFKNDAKVFHVSGYMFPLKQKLPELFFLQLATCWGWGTWQRAWRQFTTMDAFEIKNKLQKDGQMESFNLGGNWSFEEQLNQNIYSKKKTWAIFWYYTLFSTQSLSLHPGRSLTQNIGHDNSGNNSASTTVYDVKLSYKAPNVHSIPMVENAMVRKYLESFPIQANWKSKANAFGRKVVKKLHVTIEKIKIRNRKRFQPFETHILGRKKTKGIDNISFLFQYDEIFKREIYKFHSNVNDPLIIDCGSNVGLSVLYFKRLFPASKVIAFECDPAIYKVLEENVRNHQFSLVELHHAAVWDAEGTLSFEQDGADGGKISKNEGNAVIQVPAVPLRTFLQQRVHFLKLDIEGSEHKVLTHCKDLLENVDHIFLEYHSFKDENQTLNEILSILKEAGFRYYIDNAGIRSPQPFKKREIWSGMDNQLNIFAYRE